MSTYCQDVTYTGKARIDHGDGDRYEFVEYTEPVCVEAKGFEEASQQLKVLIDGFCAAQNGPRFALCKVVSVGDVKMQNPNY